MSETTSTPTDGTPGSDAPSSSAVDTSGTPASQTGAPADSSPPSSGTDSQPAPSSGDSRQSDRDGLFAVIRKVVETKPETPAIPSDQTDADQGPEDQSPKDQAAALGSQETSPDASATQIDPNAETDPTEAELKRLRPETRRRFERLLTQRNEARQNYEAAQPELAQHRQLQGYLQQHQLAPDDVNLLLGVGAALRRQDYQSFLDGVTPYVIAAQEALGLRVSNDLLRQVEDGTIDEATARELTKTRHRAMQAEARLNETTKVADTNQQTQRVAQIRSAVENWEASIQTRDPDYAQMSGAVRRYAQGLLQERGIPQTAEQALALTQAAYDEVKREFAKMRPAPRPTRNVPSGIHVATGSATAEPKSMKEAALMALANMRRAS